MSLALLVPWLIVASCCTALAQAQSRGTVAAEAAAGVGAFVDDSFPRHDSFGVAARVYVTRRIGLGPEFVYMRGPGNDRDIFLTGNVTVDVASRAAGGTTVTPFVVAGAGLFRHANRYATFRISHVEGGLTAGGGVRLTFGRRMYAAVDARAGWEPHFRIAGVFGLHWSPASGRPVHDDRQFFWPGRE